jgi:hypothetical protein
MSATGTNNVNKRPQAEVTAVQLQQPLQAQQEQQEQKVQQVK